MLAKKKFKQKSNKLTKGIQYVFNSMIKQLIRNRYEVKINQLVLFIKLGVNICKHCSEAKTVKRLYTKFCARVI